MATAVPLVPLKIKKKEKLHVLTQKKRIISKQHDYDLSFTLANRLLCIEAKRGKWAASNRKVICIFSRLPAVLQGLSPGMEYSQVMSKKSSWTAAMNAS